MMQFIGCDAYKKYSVFVAVDEQGRASRAQRVGHDRQKFREFLERLPRRSPIAIEASTRSSWFSGNCSYYILRLPAKSKCLKSKTATGSLRSSWNPRKSMPF